MSDLELDCIESWKKILPDFQFKRWDEDNFDYESFRFSREAYKLKKFAFVSDVCRLFALHDDGGVYLDTDMMLLKDFTSLLNQPFFISEEREGIISAGVIGCETESKIVKRLLEGYRRMPFDFDKPMDIPTYLTSMLDRAQIMVYPKEYFYALPFKKREEDFSFYVTPNSFAVHLWNYSWRNEWSYLHEKKFLKSWEQYLKSIRIRGLKKKDAKYLVAFSKFWIADRFPQLYRSLKKSEQL